MLFQAYQGRREPVAQSRQATSPTKRSNQLIWCVWGTILALLPFTLRSDAIFFFDVTAFMAPLHYSPAALALALIILALIKFFHNGSAEKKCHRVIEKNPIVIATMTLIIVCVCEFGFLPMRFHNYSLLAFQPIFELIGTAAQAVSYASWILLGSLCLGAERKSERDTNQKNPLDARLGIVMPLFVAGWISIIGITPFLLPLQLSFTVVSCAISGALAWKLLNGIASGHLSRANLTRCLSQLFCATLSACTFRTALSSLLALPMLNLYPPDRQLSLFIVLCGYGAFFLFLLVLLSISFALSSKRVEDVPDGPRAPSFDAIPGKETLSERQSLVLSLASEGLTTAEIAERIGIASGTVGTYRSRALAKLGLKSFDEFMAIVKRQTAEEVAEATLKAKKRRRRHALRGALALVSLLLFSLFRFEPGLISFAALLAGLIVVDLVLTTCHLSDWKELPTADLYRWSVSKRLICLLCSLALALCLFASWWLIPIPWVFLIAILVVLASFSFRPTKTSAESALHPLLELGRGVDIFLFSLPHASLVFGSTLLICGCIAIPWRVIALAKVLATAAIATAALFLISKRQGVAKGASQAEGGPELKLLKSRGLNDMESQVVLLAARGYTRRQICETLSIAPGTVNGCKATAYRKLGIHSSREAQDLIASRAHREDAGIIPMTSPDMTHKEHQDE